MKLRATYYKSSGKFYSSADFEYPDSHFYNALAKFRVDRQKGINPGLVPRASWHMYIVLQEVTDGEVQADHLILPYTPEEELTALCTCLNELEREDSE